MWLLVLMLASDARKEVLLFYFIVSYPVETHNLMQHQSLTAVRDCNTVSGIASTFEWLDW